MRTLGERVTQKVPGFESLPLRQNFASNKILANFGRESRIEIRDLMVGDFRFGQFSIIDFQNRGVHL